MKLLEDFQRLCLSLRNGIVNVNKNGYSLSRELVISITKQKVSDVNYCIDLPTSVGPDAP